jgi:hypothetical protein
MQKLDYQAAHEFVDRSKNVFWDNYDIIIWKRNANGATNMRGMFRNGAWGIANRFTVGSDGYWKVPNKYANR